jgi:uncharacterized protein
MNTLRAARRIVLALAVAVLPFCLLACGSSQAPRLYTLNSIASSSSTEPQKQEGSSVLIGVGPIEIPDYLDQAQIITRTSRNQLNISEFDLWGGSLKEDVSRVLLEDLSSLLTPSGIAIVSWKSYVPCTVRLPITILRLDATRGGTVSLRAKWAVIRKDVHKFEVLRETVLTKPVKGN